jgi:hypothetical protein
VFNRRLGEHSVGGIVESFIIRFGDGIARDRGASVFDIILEREQAGMTLAERGEDIVIRAIDACDGQREDRNTCDENFSYPVIPDV